jgi:hypothetical protein
MVTRAEEDNGTVKSIAWLHWTSARVEKGCWRMMTLRQTFFPAWTMTRKGGGGRWRRARRREEERSTERSARKRNGNGEALLSHTCGDKAVKIWWAEASCGGYGLKAVGLGAVGTALTSGPRPVGDFFKYSKIVQTCKFKKDMFYCSKDFKLCMRLNMNSWSNFLNWTDFKFPTEFML